MPVTPTYSWSQTIDQVDIRVKLPGLTRQKPDIFVTDVLVKVVAHPYVLLLDLHAAIDSDNGAAYATPGDIVFKLPKVRCLRLTAIISLLRSNWACLGSSESVGLSRESLAHGVRWFTMDPRLLLKKGGI